MSELAENYYRNLVLSIKCRKAGNRIILAKPIFVLAILETIANNQDNHNVFQFEGELKKQYSYFCEKYKCTAPYYYPFYHLEHDGFWHLCWRDGVAMDCKSNKYLSENIRFGYLDMSFWTFLQKEDNRDYFKSIIINNFSL